MTEEHKAALAEGREQGRIVRNYLEALEQSRPRRGRPKSREAIESRLAEVTEQIASADPLSRLLLSQKKFDLESELAAMDGVDDTSIEELEEAFVDVAAAYGERRGITYAAWRAVGVPASVLRRAGMQGQRVSA